MDGDQLQLINDSNEIREDIPLPPDCMCGCVACYDYLCVS